MKILVTGSSGLIGSELVSFLQRSGYEVYKLVRSRADLLEHEIAWDVDRGVINPLLLEGLDAVVHLAGENIMGRWTTDKKERIRKSRVNGTRLLCQALCQLKYPPATFICASAVGYYGNRGDEILVEQSGVGHGFLAHVCEEWEEATRMAAEKGIRTLNLRIGFVLSAKGGGLKHMLTIFKWGLGGKIGTGQQYMSWITLDDLIRIILFLLREEQLAGPINAVSPHPVTNEEWTKTLGHVLHRPTFFSMPTAVVQLLFGELGQEVFLNSTRVKPQKLEESNFHFDYPNLEEAFETLIH